MGHCNWCHCVTEKGLYVSFINRVWRVSEQRIIMEEQDRFMVAGDSAYPITRWTVISISWNATNSVTVWNEPCHISTFLHYVSAKWIHDFVWQITVTASLTDVTVIAADCKLIFTQDPDEGMDKTHRTEAGTIQQIALWCQDRHDWKCDWWVICWIVPAIMGYILFLILGKLKNRFPILSGSLSTRLETAMMIVRWSWVC